MKIKTIEAYTFWELPKEVQSKIIENNRDINIKHNWSEFIEEDLIEAGNTIGIDIDNLYWSGFYSQGDGACFEGTYQYSPENLKKVVAYYPQEKELHRIAQGLAEVQKRIRLFDKRKGHRRSACV